MSLSPNSELHTQIQYRLMEKLSESEKRYRELVETLTEIVFETDAQGCLMFLNSAWTENLGYSVQESLGLPLEQFLHPEECRMDQFTALLQNATPIKGEEVRFWSQQHGTLWFEVSAQPKANQGFSGSMVNITDRKQAEFASCQSQEQYRTVVNNLKEVIFQTDATGIWIFLNPAWTEITGFSLEESLGRNFLEFVYPEDRQLNLERFQPLIERQKEYCRHEIRYLTKESGYCWIEVFARLTLDEQGTIVGTSGTLNDITERKRVRETLQLQVKQAQLVGAIAQRIRQSLHLNEILTTTVTEIRQLLETDRVLLYQLEADWSGTVIVEASNGTCIPLLGRHMHDTCFAQESCITSYLHGRIQAIADIYSVPLPECYVQMLAQLQVRANLVVPILQGHQLWGLLIVQHCAGVRFWQTWEIELLQQLVIQLGFAIQHSQLYEQLQEELGQREYALRELQLAQEQLQASLHEKEILLKEIHHRVKNNLLVVSSLLEWQTDYIDDPVLLKMIGESQNRIQSMALIHEKLYQAHNLAQIDLGEYLETLVNQLFFSSNLNLDTIKLHFDLEPILLNIETVTPCGLIVSELVSNVFEHAFPDTHTGHLWLGTKQVNGEVMVMVKDNGVGLPEPFNICATESMGFQLVCLLTQQLEGEIAVDRESGTCFTLRFSELNYDGRI